MRERLTRLFSLIGPENAGDTGSHVAARELIAARPIETDASWGIVRVACAVVFDGGPTLTLVLPAAVLLAFLRLPLPGRGQRRGDARGSERQE